LLIIEEYYDNIIILIKLEKTLNTILNHQIYTHYTMFSRNQSYQASYDLNEKNKDRNNDEETLKFR